MTDEMPPRIWCNMCGTTLLDETSLDVTQDDEGYWVVRGHAALDPINDHHATTGHDTIAFTLRVELTPDECDQLFGSGISHISSFPSRAGGGESMTNNGYNVGERICIWFGDSVDCGVVQEVDTLSRVPHYDVLMDTRDGQPIPIEKRETWTVIATDDLWREHDGPSAAMREKIMHWYREDPPEGLRQWLDKK